MIKHKLFLLVALTVMSSSALIQAQNTTDSPYTRYAYGKLADQSFTGQRGMGGIGYGLRNSKMINPLNPASYSAVDSLTFMFEAGLMGQIGLYEDGLNKANKSNGGLEYLAMQFPLWKGFGMGVGFEPVSHVGYQYGDTLRTNVMQERVQNSYIGKGGLHKVYTSLAYTYKDRLSLGVNLAYMWGDVVHSREVSYYNSNNYNSARVDSICTAVLTYKFGLQYVHPLTENKNLVFGLVYAPKISMGSEVRTGEYNYNPSSGSIEGDPVYTRNKDLGFEMPDEYGFGVTYNQKDHLTVGADVLYQRWGSALYYGETGQLSDRLKVNAGLEYIPDVTGRGFLSRIRYRAGANYANSYMQVEVPSISQTGVGFKEYGASIGLGIPLVDRRSFVNLSFDYSRLTPDVPEAIKEQYFRLTISYTFNELWFFKRKVL